jgi:hypothetical protein
VKIIDRASAYNGLASWQDRLLKCWAELEVRMQVLEVLAHKASVWEWC